MSAIALGGVIAALTLTVAQGQYGGKGPKILAGVMVVSTIALELFTHSWWMEDKALIVTPVLAMACGLNVMQLPYGIAFVAFPFFFHRWNGTIYWGLNRMITQYSDVKSINAGEQMQFLFSPAFLVSLMAFVCVTALGGKYLRHVASKGLEESYSARALFWAALSTACLGLREAYLLPAALVVAITGCLVWLFDSARSL